MGDVFPRIYFNVSVLNKPKYFRFTFFNFPLELREGKLLYCENYTGLICGILQYPPLHYDVQPIMYPVVVAITRSGDVTLYHVTSDVTVAGLPARRTTDFNHPTALPFIWRFSNRYSFRKSLIYSKYEVYLSNQWVEYNEVNTNRNLVWGTNWSLHDVRHFPPSFPLGTQAIKPSLHKLMFVSWFVWAGRSLLVTWGNWSVGFTFYLRQ